MLKFLFGLSLGFVAGKMPREFWSWARSEIAAGTRAAWAWVKSLKRGA